MATKKTTPKKSARKKKVVADKPAQAVIDHGFKGYTKDFTCTGGGTPFQYEVGKSYEEPEASLCNKGFHYCKHPLDTWNYYPPTNGNRYSNVAGEAPETNPDGDSKHVTKKLTIGAELSIESLTKAAVKFVWESATSEAKASEESSATSGYKANAATSGNWANAATSGEGANAATSGYKANAATSGYKANAATSGEGANAATSGEGANAATSGYKANAASLGDYGKASVEGEQSIAMACGRDGKAKACLGSWIVLAERDGDNNILTMRCAVIDGTVLKPDTYYSLEGGNFVEAEA